jgi:cholesterol oxidase
MQTDYDYIVIGSGFGGSVSALRLTEKGYRVLLLEQGKRLTERDFPKGNWNLKKWLWMPALRFFGFFRITWFRHITVLSGAGVGGGSLVYANTLAEPGREFFTSPCWAHLADWEAELKELYPLARRMLGAVPCPRLETGDAGLETLAQQLGKAEGFTRTTVAVFFGEPDKTVPDPYFGGKGPDRAGCNFCGGCMVGCRFNAKNTLTKNYLYLAEQQGLTLLPERMVTDVQPCENQDGTKGYRVTWRSTTSLVRRRGEFTCRGVVFAGGVLGTVPLLLKLKQRSLPDLSDMVGRRARTNSESLFGVTAYDRDRVFSDGIAISSILQTDPHTHLEPVRYPAGSGFWRMLQAPLVPGRNCASRLVRIIGDLVIHPVTNLKVLFVDDWAKRTQILLFMRTLDSTLRFTRGPLGLRTTVEQGAAPRALEPDALELAERYGRIVKAKPMTLLSESLLGIPTTAHILGGAVMGRDRNEGVIDRDNRVFGYENLYVCDGSMISANPGVNPALTITVLSERAMSKVPPKQA